MAKRFTVGGYTRDKEYVLTKGAEGSKLLWFSISGIDDAETVRVMLRPKPKLRITQVDVNFNEHEVKGRGTNGNIVSRHSASKVIKLSDAKPSQKPVQATLEAVTKQVPVKPKAAPAPAPKATKKPEGKSTPKKASPLHEEKAVTVEWDFNGKKDSISSDRDRILSELEQKAKDKKTQTKMDF